MSLKGCGRSRGRTKYSSIPATALIWIRLATTASKHDELRQFDAEQAFLEVSVDEEIYSQGSRGISGVPGSMVLVNNIYGIVLARRSLFKIFCDDRSEQSKEDPRVFFKFNDGQVEMVVAVHVDDILAHA